MSITHGLKYKLMAIGSVGAVSLMGVGVAHALTNQPGPPLNNAQSTSTTEVDNEHGSVTKPDTDNIQQGGQNGPQDQSGLQDQSNTGPEAADKLAD